MMTPVLAAEGIARGLSTMALQHHLNSLHSPSEALEGNVDSDARFRLSGVVLEESVEPVPSSLDVCFQATDLQRAFPLGCHGILPDLFRERRRVIAPRRIDGDALVAGQRLAKHYEICMPAEEVVEKMARTKVACEAAAIEGGAL